MVISKLKGLFNSNDEKVEFLIHKLSKSKSEYKNLKNRYNEDLNNLKEELKEKFARELIDIYEDILITKEDSFKVRSTNKEIQSMFISLNNAEKKLENLLKKYSVDVVIPKERMFDPELHEVASYVKANGVEKGVILKTVRKGFKFKNKYVKKPRVVVAS
jgi:molecular chaperone GrpE